MSTVLVRALAPMNFDAAKQLPRAADENLWAL
jgi:hypothetical protein